MQLLCSLTQSTFKHIFMQDSGVDSGTLKVVNCVLHLKRHPESQESRVLLDSQLPCALG